MSVDDGAAQAPAASGPVPSPCVNVCRIDAATGWCEGCQRTIDEITAWSQLDEAGKRAVWALLPARRQQWSRRQRQASAGALR
jgi:hypothetical protein